MVYNSIIKLYVVCLKRQKGEKKMYYARFYPYGWNTANVFDIFAFNTKQERDNWYTKNQFDCNGFLQAERLPAQQVYKITGRKMTNWCKIKIGDYYILLKI